MHHVLLASFWKLEFVGAANSVDPTDADFDEGRIELVHRPDQGADAFGR